MILPGLTEFFLFAKVGIFLLLLLLFAFEKLTTKTAEHYRCVYLLIYTNLFQRIAIYLKQHIILKFNKRIMCVYSFSLISDTYNGNVLNCY